MTREEAAKWAELYQAYADGKAIQFYDGGKWWDIDVSFDDALHKYRIKPEPKKIEFWVNVYEDHFDKPHSSKAKADDTAYVVPKTRIACLHIVREYEEGEGL